MNHKLSFYILLIIISIFACSQSETTEEIENPYQNIEQGVEKLDPYPQRLGNAEKGLSYLLYGDFVDSGVPATFYDQSFGLMIESKNELNREAPNDEIAFPYTQVKAPNGVDIVAPNCFQCHAGYVDGDFHIGLGNNEVDNTIDQGVIAPLLDQFIVAAYGENSPEYTAYRPFSQAISATSGKLITEVVGANSADKLAVVLAAHRDPVDLTWQENPVLPIPGETIPADVPAWWLLKKKNAMFSTGIGRKDFARIMMASSILTMQDSTKAREVDENFIDVLAFINQLEPPVYKYAIDSEKAARGEVIFEETCSKCHGTYGAEVTYPNLLVKHELLQTDSLLANSNFAYSEFVSWYNGSWFSKGPHGAAIVPTDGYVAPPLDGIWATAPYLHNGSIPTLWDVLKSTERPSIWRRSLGDNNYDQEKIGIPYSSPTSKIDRYTFDTSIPGYGNMGHYFGDHLSDPQRWDLIEYLKSI